ncbi:MAG: hypothetical protein RIR51_1040 [Bacteroidota bacterium]|jgi:hypothetical protein
MKRRDYLKNIGLSTLGMAVLSPDIKAAESLENFTVEGLVTDDDIVIPPGRTLPEAIHDAKLMKEKFFNDHELKTLEVLSDLIIPADGGHGGAKDAKVNEFIEFMAKDNPSFQTPLRGGMKWLDRESQKRFSKNFIDLSDKQKFTIADDIAYPEEAKPEFSQGVAFFSLMRNLTASGYFTSKIGIEYIGYKGNVPNEWEGVPKDVLAQYGFTSDDIR